MSEFEGNISPFFAIEAEKLLSEGKITESIALCNVGISTYPDYQSAYIVLFKAYLKNNELSKAKELISNCLQLFPKSKQFERLKLELSQHIANEIQLEPKQQEPQDTQIEIQPQIISDDSPEFIKRQFLKKFIEFPEEYNYQYNIKASDLSLIPGLELSLHQLNRQRVPKRDYIKAESEFSNKTDFKATESQAFNIQNDKKDDENQLAPLITETLANIYESQGAFIEAIRAYEVLSLMYPERAEKYNSKIQNLRKRIK